MMKHVILAGGNGTRLWPFSRNAYPKQFLHFGDGESLLQKTVKRFYPGVPASDILIVTSKTYLHITKKQLTEIDPAFEKQILIEPEKRNTAPAICLAVKYFRDVLKASEKDSFLVSSADHIITPEETFVSAVFQGESAVRAGKHLIFGIRPNKPETGYGYIKTGGRGPHFSVEQFVEKPDKTKAQIYLLSGNYLWNAGIFLFQIKAFLEDIQTHCPEINSLMSGSFEQVLENFHRMPDISIDYALLEKSSKLLVAPLDVSWSDVGSWDSIYDLFDKDANQNVKLGNILDIDTSNCLIMGGKRLISTVGLEDMLIVDTEDALFIGKKGESQTVKHLVQEMKKRNAKESSEHVISHRPWGSIEILKDEGGYRIRHFILEPGKSLGDHLIAQGNEHWMVTQGVACITIEQEKSEIPEQESFTVQDAQKYFIENKTKSRLELIQFKTCSDDLKDKTANVYKAYQTI